MVSVDPSSADSTVSRTPAPPALRHAGQPLSFLLEESNLLLAAFSQPSSSVAFFFLSAVWAAVVWHLTIAAASLATLFEAASSHFAVALSGGTKPVSSGSGMI